MKRVIVLFILSICWFYLKAQTKIEKIARINRWVYEINKDSALKVYEVKLSELPDKNNNEKGTLAVSKKGGKIVKIEFLKKNGWNGGYEKTIICIRRTKPIFVRKEYKEVIDAELLNGTHEISEEFRQAKFYILNWRKSIYKKVYTEEASSKIKFEKNEIERIIELSKNLVWK